MRNLHGYDGPIGDPTGGVRPFGRVYHDPISVITAGAGIFSAMSQSDAAENAAGIQSQAAMAGVAQQNKQFEAVQKLLEPYVQGGNKSITEQLNLLGLNGTGPQSSSINSIATGPQFSALAKSGEDAILQNASATGNLRGGNTEGALAQFRPQLLQQMIDQQYARLGGITNIGQNAAAGVGNAGAANANSVSNLLGQQGAALAGSALANGKAQAGYANAITGGLGVFKGQGNSYPGIPYNADTTIPMQPGGGF